MEGSIEMPFRPAPHRQIHPSRTENNGHTVFAKGLYRRSGPIGKAHPVVYQGAVNVQYCRFECGDQLRSPQTLVKYPIVSEFEGFEKALNCSDNPVASKRYRR